MIYRLTVFVLVFATFGCMSETGKAEQAAKKAQQDRMMWAKKALSDSMAITFIRFKAEVERIKPARKRCKVAFDTFMEALKSKGKYTLLDFRAFYISAALEAAFNAHDVFGDVREAGIETLSAIIDYETLAKGSTDEQIMLWIDSKVKTAKANYDYCEEVAKQTKGAFDNP